MTTAAQSVRALARMHWRSRSRLLAAGGHEMFVPGLLQSSYSTLERHSVSFDVALHTASTFIPAADKMRIRHYLNAIVGGLPQHFRIAIDGQ